MRFDFSHIGVRYKNFSVTQFLPLEEIGSTLIELTHLPTGASIVHLENTDTENVFCISLRTLPESSNGVAHILEHTVLCGSKKFPVKDPFFSMTRRSLATFMNAFTGADFTCYPASSELKVDFYNLLDVYLDAVFFPELKKTSFLQEGWRYEFQNEEKTDSRLIYKGIVFNEMKGALNSADQRTWHKLLSSLTPHLPYAFDSGGDPKEIPSLTYENLVDFHKTFYHPSNALFFFYGNLPLEGHLDVIEKEVLCYFSKQNPLPPIPQQLRFLSPIKKIGYYPALEGEEEAGKAIFALGFLTTSIRNAEEALALQLLDSMLMDTDASLLKRPILESGLCQEADSLIDGEMSELPYLIICKGCEEKQIVKLRDLIFSSLQQIAAMPIESELIEAAIHQLEFERSEISTNSLPYGLSLFMRSCLAKQHGGHIEDHLKIHSLCKNVRDLAKNPHFFTDLIKHYFLNNSHRVELTMLRDPLLNKKEDEEEQDKLYNIAKAMSSAEKKAITLQADELKTYQKRIESQDLNCLPKTPLKEIKPQGKHYLLEKEKTGNLKTYFHACHTNGIVYVDLNFPLPQLNESQLFDLSLFSSLLADVGTVQKDYGKLLEEIQRYTGGIGSFISLASSVDNPNTSSPILVLRGKALTRHSDRLFSLLHEIATQTTFTNQTRITQLLEQQYSYLEHKLSSNPLKYASSLAASAYFIPSYLQERWYGLTYFDRVKGFVKNAKSHIPPLLSQLAHMQEHLLKNKDMELVIGSSEQDYVAMRKNNFFGIAEIGTLKQPPWKGELIIPPVSSQFIQISSPVAFSALAYRTCGYKDPSSPYLLLATELFDNTILHKKIREEGGAYGGGANYSPSSGVFNFYSYRDPHIASTKKVMEEAILKIAAQDFSESDLEEAKLGIFQKLDSPLSPGSRARLSYILEKEGKTQELRLLYRKQLLNATGNDVALAVAKHLASQKDRGTFISFGGKELLEKENKSFVSKGEQPFSVRAIAR